MLCAEPWSKCCRGNLFLKRIYQATDDKEADKARGALVDEAALLAALESGQLSAAGLDCFQVEPGGNPDFSRFDNIFMLPHIGSATRQTRDAMGFRALDNLDAFFAGNTPGDRL